MNKDYRVLRKSMGNVQGSHFEVGGKYGFQSKGTGMNILIDTGMPAPDMIEMVYTLFLLASFGDSGSNPVVLHAKINKKNDTARAEVYLELLDSVLDVQNKASLLGRVYMTYGDIKIVRKLEMVGNGKITTYEIIEDPTTIERIEYKNRLMGYYNTMTKEYMNPEDVIHIYNRNYITSVNREVNLKFNNTTTDKNNSALVIDSNEGDGRNKFSCKCICGSSPFATSAGLLDIYPIKLAKMINDSEANKPKAVIMVNTGAIKDPSMRNNIFNSVVSSCKSEGSLSYLEIVEGITVDVTPIAESTVNQAQDDINSILQTASMHAYLSMDIISGEKNIFEDFRSKMMINDIRSSVTKALHNVLENEVGKENASTVKISVRSSLPEESDAILDTLQRGSELMTTVSDMAELLNMKVKETALPYVSEKLGIDFTELIRDISTKEKAEKESEAEEE
ncbi:MAG: hypothetical protein ACRC0R_02695 [Cetobacterium sp.]